MAQAMTDRVLTETFGPSEGAALRIKQAFLVVAGIALLAIMAKIKLPVPPSPVAVNMGTFAVLTIGAAYGARLGLVTIIGYMLIGALGFDVFQSSTAELSGIDYMTGSTGGYLLGYVMATVLLGALARRGWDRSVVWMAVAMLAGNIILYVPGLLWLGQIYGWDKPILEWGLTPFVIGDLMKLALAAMILPAAWKLVGRARGCSRSTRFGTRNAAPPGAAFFRGSGEVGQHAGGPLERLVDRALVGDLAQLGALRGRQPALEPDAALEGVDLLVRGAAGVLCMDLVAAHIHLHMVQIPALAAGVHADGHRGAGAKRRGQEPVGRHAAVGPAVAFGFVSDRMVIGAVIHVLHESVGVRFGNPHDALGRAGRRCGRRQRHVACEPGSNDLGRVFGILGARDKVIGIVERDEAFRMAGGGEDARGVLDPDALVARGVQDQERAAELADRGAERGRLDILHELPPDGEGPLAQRHLGLAAARDFVQRSGEVVLHMGRVEGGRDGDDGLGGGELPGGLQDCRAAQRMADQQLGRMARVRKVPGRTDEVLDVRRKRRVGEFPVRMAKTGEVESQHRDAHRGQPLRDPARGGDVLAAGEAMRKERGRQPGPVGQGEPGSEGASVMSLEADALRWHGALRSSRSEGTLQAAHPAGKRAIPGVTRS